MKKTAIATAVALCMGMGASIAQAAPTGVFSSATFTMHSPGGGTPGVDNTVTGSIGGGTWSAVSSTPFFGFVWTAHGGTTFGPGTYSFATVEAGTYTGVVVGPNQIGGHILFDWNTTTNIDVVNVWNFCSGCGGYTSQDVTAVSPTGQPNGIRGLEMIDGAFPGFEANFDFKVAAVPVPAAVWLFGSGLLGLVGVARRKKAA